MALPYHGSGRSQALERVNQNLGAFNIRLPGYQEDMKR
jgi:hypothetical protein